MVLQEPFGKREGVVLGKSAQAEEVQAGIVRGRICPLRGTIYAEGSVQKHILL